MRTHYCGVINEEFVGQEVTVTGWAHRRRDHGGVIFIDLRDRTGIVQVVFDQDSPVDFESAETLRSEFVLQVKAKVRPRPEGTVNPDMATGQIELMAQELNILNRCAPLPFQLDEHQAVGEDTRLKYRFLDLRRPEMGEKLRFRAKATKVIRDYLESDGYLDIETPMLTKATPEGARDYLVPSRTHQGSFFALPQSPQLFKQLLMVSGMDKYYQIVKCFRDEDLRADRQPEFTQVDIEASFIDEEGIMGMAEGLIRDLFAKCLEVELPNPFPRMTYEEAMRRFGSDKPEMRNPLELVDIADLLQNVDFKVFSGPANDPKGRIAALCVPEGAGKFSRKEIDDYTKFVGIYGAKGLAYIKVNDLDAGAGGLQSPILKFLTPEAIDGILQRTGAKTGDIIFFGADKANVVNEALGALRLKIGEDLELLKGDWAPLWVVDFPMFEESERGFDALHHPFTAPSVADPAALKADPGASLSRAYDIVLNGTEVGGGSIRIHNEEMQQAAFEVLGIGEEEQREKFGFLLDALKFGCPPHGGLAFGLDRLIMLMTGSGSIRDVMAFPKTQSAACMLTDAPGEAATKQLQELGIRLKPKETEKQK